MSTVKGKRIEADILQPRVPKVTRRKTGPKNKALPESLIRQLADQGHGSKAITAQLRKQGIEVSYKTIQRLLSGQRPLLAIGS